MCLLERIDSVTLNPGKDKASIKLQTKQRVRVTSLETQLCGDRNKLHHASLRKTDMGVV